MAGEAFKDFRFGLVLAGGGAKGAYEIGALKAIKELLDFNNLLGVSGNSIGTINMAFVAGSTISKAEECWKNINPSDFLEEDSNGFELGRSGDGFLSREGLKRILRNGVDYSAVSEAGYPVLACLGKVLGDGVAVAEYVQLNKKSPEYIESCILASSAIPVVYDAVNIDGINYIDGGICDNVPVKPLYDLGIRDIVVIILDSTYRVPYEQFPGASLYPIIPSHSLEMDGVLGTADLNPDNAYYRFMLGYLDAKAALPCLINKMPVPSLAANHTVAMGELKRKKLESSVNRNQSALNDMLGKYGIEI